MADPRYVQHCRWAQPTLSVAGPLWTSADDFPWSCDADGETLLIEDTRICANCDRWAAHVGVQSARPLWRHP